MVIDIVTIRTIMRI